MGRRRQASTADDLLDLVAMLPWRAGVGLAVSCREILALNTHHSSGFEHHP